MGHLKLMILTSAVSLSWQYLSSDVGNFIKLTFILRQIYRVPLSQVFPTCPPTRNPLQAPDCGVGEDGGCCVMSKHWSPPLAVLQCLYNIYNQMSPSYTGDMCSRV